MAIQTTVASLTIIITCVSTVGSEFSLPDLFQNINGTSVAIQTTEATLGITIPCVSRVLLFPGNRWIIVATDNLTRYAETKALPYRTAVQVAKFFVERIVRNLSYRPRNCVFRAAGARYLLARPHQPSLNHYLPPADQRANGAA